MLHDVLADVLALARTSRPAFIATAGSGCFPHIAAVGKITPDSNGRLRLEDWLCPQTVENLDTNKNAALVVWDSNTNNGFQLTGRIVSIHDVAVMDGYAEELTTLPPMPQVERELTFEIDSIVEFRHGIHSDTQISGPTS